MSLFSLTSSENELLRSRTIQQMLPSLWRNPNIAFATEQQLRDEQSAHRVKKVFYLSGDNYAYIRC